jgi:NDP-sugar pyrophosphorylase family protein
MINNPFQVVILAGGLATRLRPLTQSTPKALLPINNKPFIHHQLNLLKQKGLQNIIFCIGYLGEQIMDYVGDGSQYGLTVTYSNDGENLLGTAGAIIHALPLLNDHFFVLYGDSYLDCDYLAIQKYFIESQKTGLMTVFKNNNQFDRSNVIFENGRIICYDKKNHSAKFNYIDYGLSIFHKSVFQPKKYHDLVEIHRYLLKNDNLAAFEVTNRFYEIGSFDGINKLEHLLQTSIAL